MFPSVVELEVRVRRELSSNVRLRFGLRLNRREKRESRFGIHRFMLLFFVL